MDYPQIRARVSYASQSISAATAIGGDAEYPVLATDLAKADITSEQLNGDYPPQPVVHWPPFDTYPDRNGVTAAEGSGAYGNFAPFGLSGGFYYARASVTF